METHAMEPFYNAEAVCKKIHPNKYLMEYLRLGIRPVDNRRHFSYRSIIGNVDVVKSCCGSSIVKIGNTSIICGISHEPTSPSKKYQGLGLVDINCKLSDHCNVQYQYKTKVVQLKQCTNLLQKLFIGLNVIDLESLCIEKGALVWLLRAHIICVDYDGGFWDAAVMALYLALKNIKLPTINYNLKSKCFVVDEENLKPIPIGKFPMATTFGVFQQFVVADPTKEEEELCTSFLVVVVEKNKIRIVQKRGGTTITEAQLNDCINAAKSRYPLVQKAIKSILNPN